MELWHVVTGHIKAVAMFLNVYLRTYTFTCIQRLKISHKRCFVVVACHVNSEDVSVTNARFVLLLAVLGYRNDQTTNTVPVRMELIVYKSCYGRRFLNIYIRICLCLNCCRNLRIPVRCLLHDPSSWIKR